MLQLAVDRADAHRTDRAGGALSLGAGLLTGAAVLVRPAMLFFLPLAVLWLIFRRMPVLAVALVAGAVAVIAPWTARNYRVYDRFVLVASEGGVTFWTGNHRLARGEGDLAANPDIKRAELEFRQAHAGLSSEDLEPLYYRDAVGYIADHPGWWLGLVARKAFYTLVPLGPSYALHSIRYRAASTLSYLMILPFAWLGLRRLLGTESVPTAVLLLAGSAVLVALVFFPQERFRVPVIDPDFDHFRRCKRPVIHGRDWNANRPRRHADVQRARQPAAAGEGRPRARRLPRPRGGRRLTRRNGTSRR